MTSTSATGSEHTPVDQPPRHTTAQKTGTPATAFAMDLVAIALFGLMARIAHQSEDMPLNVLGWLNTTWPFWLGVLLSWVLLWFGALGNRNGHELSSALPVWLCTVILGLVIWGIRNGSVPHWSFILVAASTSALLLWGWRAARRLFVR